MLCSMTSLVVAVVYCVIAVLCRLGMARLGSSAKQSISTAVQTEGVWL